MAGAAVIAVSVLVIGHAADIGWACRDGEGKGMIKPRAIVALGSWCWYGGNRCRIRARS